MGKIMSTHSKRIVTNKAPVKSYCVYAHRRRDNGQIFYVGSGLGDIPWKITGRSAAWNDVANKVGFDVDVVNSCLTKNEADTIVRNLVYKHRSKWLLNDLKLIKKKSKPSIFGNNQEERQTYKDTYLELFHHSGEEFMGTAFGFSRSYHIDYGAVLGLVKGYTDTLCGWKHKKVAE